jgi:hypothetical protein
VTNLFTTQAVIKDEGLVQLDDPEHILPPNNIVPLIRTDHKSDDIVATLNAVDAKLTTEALTDLVKRIDVGKESAGRGREGLAVEEPAVLSFESLWADLAAIGRDPDTGGYHRGGWTPTEREATHWFQDQCAARGLNLEIRRHRQPHRLVGRWPDGAGLVTGATWIR